MFKKIGCGIFYTLVFLVSLYAILFLVIDGVGPPFLKEKFYLTPLALYLHVIGAAIALVLGALQLNYSLRTKYFTAHKYLGRVYVIAVTVSACGGIFMATRSEGGMIGHLGFGALSVVWGGTLWMALIRIRQMNLKAHRYWMIINYSLTCAGITLRIIMPLLIGVFNLDMPTAFAVVAWASWVPNMLMAQLYLVKTKNHNNSAPAVQLLHG